MEGKIEEQRTQEKVTYILILDELKETRRYGHLKNVVEGRQHSRGEFRTEVRTRRKSELPNMYTMTLYSHIS